MRKYVRACEVCQRVKPSTSLCAPLQPLPVPAECWKSVSMDLVFGFLEDAHKNNGILVFVDRFSKMVHLISVPDSISAEGCARVFIDTTFRLHGLSHEQVSIGIHGSRQSFGVPCSDHSERGLQCLLLTGTDCDKNVHCQLGSYIFGL